LVKKHFSALAVIVTGLAGMHIQPDMIQLNNSIIPDILYMGKGGTMLILPYIALDMKENFYNISSSLTIMLNSWVKLLIQSP
jgi:Ni,Fe-hydrogenase maturation factor